MSRPRAEHLDRLVAAGLVILGQLELWLGSSMPGPKAVLAPLALLVTGAVAFRRRWPLVVGVVAMSGFVAMLLVSGSIKSVAVGAAWLCAVYGVAVWTSSREFVIGCAVLVAGSAVAQLQPNGSVDNAVTFTVVPLLAMVLARGAIRGRQLRADALAARADLLERERELHAQEAVAQERARIARELHDLVAHSVSVMVVQAGAERMALGEREPATRGALSAIEQAGRQALADARRLLEMLRRQGEGEDLEPQPGVGQIERLVEQVGRAGLPVRLEVEGERVPLPAGLDLCAYRIVQESLTNALKHAGPAQAEVRLRFGPGGLDVRVRDDGRAVPHVNGHGESGHGLIGMRERVALYGGELATGPREGGGFEVRAHLPLR